MDEFTFDEKGEESLLATLNLSNADRKNKTRRRKRRHFVGKKAGGKMLKCKNSQLKEELSM